MFARSDHHSATLGIDLHDVQRLAVSDPEPLALTDRESGDTRVLRERVPFEVDHFTREVDDCPISQEIPVVASRNETDLLALRFVRDR